MARPRKAGPDRRTETIRFVVRPDEYTRVKAAAAAAGKTLSEYARTLVLAGRVVVHQTRALEPAAIDQLRRIGVNLNQLARIANRDGAVPVGLARACAAVELVLMQHVNDGSKGSR